MADREIADDGVDQSAAEETRDKTELKNEEDRFASVRKTIVEHLCASDEKSHRVMPC